MEGRDKAYSEGRVTEYAAIHPAFPVGSLAQAWTDSRETAVEWATSMGKVTGFPVRVMSREVTTRIDYFADSSVID